MPLYERNGETIHFIHIPKCGGMSVRKLIEENGWTRIKEPDYFPVGGGHQVYSVWRDWKEAVNAGFTFTVVRHPYTRVVSHFNMWFNYLYYETEVEPVWKMLKGQISYDDKYFMDHFHRLGLEVSHEDEFVSVRDAPVEKAHAGIKKYIESLIELPGKQRAESQILYTIRNFYEKTGLDFRNMEPGAQLEFYFKNTADLGRGGVQRNPCRWYVSPETKIYKFEDLENLLKDLKDRDIISSDSVLPHSNIVKIRYMKTENIISEKIKKMLAVDYKVDFEEYGYTIKEED